MPKPDGRRLDRRHPAEPRADRTARSRRVDVIHLHHGVWLNLSATDVDSPGLARALLRRRRGEDDLRRCRRATATPYKATRQVAHQLHDPQPHADGRQGLHHLRHRLHPGHARPPPRGSTAAKPIWMDVAERRDLPGVRRASRARARTASTRIPTRTRTRIRAAGSATVDRATTTASCSAPPATCTRAACTTTCSCTGRRAPLDRHGKVGAPDTAHLFRSGRLLRAGRRGVVGRRDDGTPPDWRVQVHKGDKLRDHRDLRHEARRRGTSRWGSWSSAWPTAAGGPDPFVNKVDSPGQLTHGHLPENDNHGGDRRRACPTRPSSPTARCVGADRSTSTTSSTASGDMSVAGPDACRRWSGRASATFTEQRRRSSNGIWHTITACKAPCNRSTGIAYPLRRRRR